MGDAADFLSSFHNLEGDLPGERKKNLFKLFAGHKSLSNEQLNEALKKLEPKNYQESLFRIDALLYFNKTEELIELLKNGNNVFASKILKHPRFFKEAFQDVDAGTLVEDFFPYLSYVIRKKLLNRISECWSEEKMDKLFSALDKRYGLTAAVEVLHKCSPGKITSVLEEDEIKLRPNQVIRLFNKSKEVFKLYLDHFHQITEMKYDEDKVLNYVAIKDPNFLLDLERDEKARVCRLGRRTTKNIMKFSKDKIAGDITRYVRFLNNPVLVRKFSPDFGNIYKQVIPTKFKSFSWYSWNLIKHYPKHKRWELFLKTFLEKFPNKSVSDIFLTLDYDVKQLNPPKEVIYQWAEFFYENRANNYEDYLQYYPTSRSIPMLKEKINVTSDSSRRSDLLKLLVNTCIENNDLGALEEVLKYISLRHRNEKLSFRHEMIWRMDRLPFPDLNENHWKYIDEQIQILRAHEEFAFRSSMSLMYRHLEFLFKNGKEHTTPLTIFMKYWKEDDFYFSVDLKNPVIEKEMFSEMCRKFQDIFKPDSESYEHDINAFMITVMQFSLHNKDYCINLSDFPYFVSQIEKNIEVLENDDYITSRCLAQFLIYNNTFPQRAVPIDPSKIVKKVVYVSKKDNSLHWILDAFGTLVKKKNRAVLGQELFKGYMEELFEENPDGKTVLWFLKHEPKSIEPHFGTILKGSLKYLGNRWECPLDCKLLRHYSHLDFDRKALDFFMKQLDVVDKKNPLLAVLVESLAILLSTEGFNKVVEERFLPKKYKLDLEDEEMREIYKIQCDVAKILARVLEPYKMLPTIMKFAKGDYLQSALPSLYAAFYNSPQRILYSYVEQLSNQAVSVRKHAIFLSCAVLDKEHSINLLKTTDQTNVSSQKHLFSATLKYFLKNPSRDLLEKVVESMDTIDKQDTETLESLKSVLLPKKYRHTYFEKCWKFFENLACNGVYVKQYLQQLLTSMCGEILPALSSDFVTYVLEQYLPIDTENRLNSIDEFTIQVLKRREHNFELVFELLVKLDKKLLHDFFNSFLSVARDEMDDKNFIQSFSDYWNKHFTITDTLQEHIALKLLLLRVYNRDAVEYARSVVDYMGELISQMSFLVFSVLKEQIHDALSSSDLEFKMKFYSALLEYKTDPNTCVLVIQLLEQVDDDEDEQIKTIHDGIKDSLKNVDVPIVKAYYKSYFAC